jgi:hypothetical protein
MKFTLLAITVLVAAASADVNLARRTFLSPGRGGSPLGSNNFAMAKSTGPSTGIFENKKPIAVASADKKAGILLSDSSIAVEPITLDIKDNRQGDTSLFGQD